MMNHRGRISLIFGAVLLWSAGLGRAQKAPPPPPAGEGEMPGGDWTAAPFAERIELLGFQGMHGGKVVTGAPFSAVAVSETTQTLADGNHIARKSQTNLFRDSQGRFRKEVTLPAIGPLATSEKSKSFVLIHEDRETNGRAERRAQGKAGAPDARSQCGQQLEKGRPGHADDRGSERARYTNYPHDPCGTNGK